MADESAQTSSNSDNKNDELVLKLRFCFGNTSADGGGRTDQGVNILNLKVYLSNARFFFSETVST